MVLFYWWLGLIFIGLFFYWFLYLKIFDFSFKSFVWILLNFFTIPIITLADIWANKTVCKNALNLFEDKLIRKKLNLLRFFEVLYLTLIIGSFINNFLIEIIVIIFYLLFNLGGILYPLTHKIKKYNIMIIINLGISLYLFFV